MFKISADVLELSKEAVVIARGDRIVYLNPPAKELLGDNCESVKSAFGTEIASAQAGNFIGSTSIKGKSCVLRVTRSEGSQTIFFSCQKPELSILNEAIMCSLRSALMNCGMATDLCRIRMENLKDEELSNALAMLTKSQFALKRLIGNMTTVRSLMEDDLSFIPVNMDLADFIRKCVDSAAELRSDVHISYRGPERLEAAADPRLVQTMLSNLISNALVHGEGCSRVNIDLMEVGELACLSVSDDGAGMDQSCLQTVFERYCHVFKTSELSGGAGLGMTVVRGVAEAHGGALLLESREGRGTTARVSLRRKLRDERRLRTGQESYGPVLKELLLGLADCLDMEYYKEKYMD